MVKLAKDKSRIHCWVLDDWVIKAGCHKARKLRRRICELCKPKDGLVKRLCRLRKQQGGFEQMDKKIAEFCESLKRLL
jgi:hypothetical protein